MSEVGIMALIPSEVIYFMEDSSAIESPRRNESCLICRKRLLSPTKRSARQENNREEIPPDEILKQIASILEVSPRIYRDVGIDEVPGPVLCTSCTRAVADAYNFQQAMKTLESQLKRLTEIIKGEIFNSFRLDTAKEIVEQIGTDCMEIKLIRKTYAQCLGICQVKARPCDVVNIATHLDDNCLSPLSGPVDVDVDGIDDDYCDMESNSCDPLDVSMTDVVNSSDEQVGPSTQIQGLGQTDFSNKNSSSISPPVSFVVPELAATLSGTSHLPRASKGRRLWKCPRCGRLFTKSSSLKGHLNKKKPCVPVGVDVDKSTFVRIATDESILQSNVVTPDVKIEAQENSEILNEIRECKYDPRSSIAGYESQPANLIPAGNSFPAEPVNTNLSSLQKIVEDSLARICEVRETMLTGSYDESDSGDNFEPAEGTDSDSSYSEFEERESKILRSNVNQKNKSLDCTLTSNMDSIKCPHCNIHFQNTLELWSHQKEVHGVVCRRSPNCGSRFKCEMCGRTYSAYRSLYDHMKTKHTAFQYSCNICGLQFGTRFLLKKHKEVGHGKHSECNLCEEVVPEGKLKEHLEMHDGSADFPCKRCPMRLATSRALILHRSRYHDEGVVIQTKVFSCKVCPMKFDKFPDFLDHRRDHQQQLKQRTFKCSLCNAYFKSETRLRAHREHHAEGSKKFKCSFCSETFDKIPEARIHMNTVHANESEAVLVCTICGEKLSSKEILQKHLDNHKGEKNFPCKSCPAQFSKEAGLRAHLLRYHRPNIRCGVCHKSCPSYDELRAHKKSEHGLDIYTCCREKRHKCTFCPKSFTKKITLTYHLKRHAGKVNFNCTVCDAVFKTSHKLKHHLGWHEKGKIPEEKDFKFKCEICEKTLSKEDAIERHMKSHANPDEFISRYIEAKVDDDKNLISFGCKVCKKIFTRGSYTNNEGQLQIICEHGNCGRGETFTDLKVFMFHHKKVCKMSYGLEHFKAAMLSKCDECDKDFKTPRRLIVHKQLRHPGPGSFMCEICGRAFGVRNMLEYHMGMHNTELNFQCHVCGNKFKSKQRLNSHINRNHREPRYPCDICGKQFKTPAHSRNHKEAVHSEAKPQFPCHICGKLFKTKPYVINHIYSTHDKRRKRGDRQPSEHGDQEEIQNYY